MTPALPPTIELCARIRDGHICLGRIHRSGTPRVVTCMACGSRDGGVVYQVVDVATQRFLDASAAVWRYIDRHQRCPTVPGTADWAEGDRLRTIEHAAWNDFKVAHPGEE
jgi:hypothetical protein